MSYAETKEQLVNPFKSALADAEELVKATASLGDEKIKHLREKAEESLRGAKASVANAQDTLHLKAMYAADAIDDRVSAKPWESMGVVAIVALGVGFLAGVLVSRD